MTDEAIAEVAPGVPAGLEKGLRNFWYPLLESSALGTAAPVAVRLLGEDLVLWRDRDGQPHALADHCPHRWARLSLGRVLGGDLQCAYHGLRFDGRGRCVLVPWEPDGSPPPEGMVVPAYPAAELGGLVWGYLGDVDAFPAPPLAEAAPPELSDDAYARYTMTEVWQTNWLIGLDGTDRFHATILHAEVQAVANDEWKGGPTRPAEVPLADRRIKLLETPEGVRGFSVDLQGNAIHTGHVTTTGIPYFQLPCLITNEFVAAPGTEPYRNRLWVLPIDAEHTRATRCISQRATTPEARARWARLYEDVVRPRTLGVSAQDAAIAESQGSLAESRTNERLLRPDADVYRMRQRIRAEFLLQRQGRRYGAGDSAPAVAATR
jgi:phenylpropionate dioxygenase-like ring-hydroxylating dioxygenase large terminal subunit